MNNLKTSLTSLLFASVVALPALAMSGSIAVALLGLGATYFVANYFLSLNYYRTVRIVTLIVLILSSYFILINLATVSIFIRLLVILAAVVIITRVDSVMLEKK